MAERPVFAAGFARELRHWGYVQLPRDVREFGTVVGMVAWRVAKQRAAVKTGAMKGNIVTWQNSVPLGFNPQQRDRSPKGTQGSGASAARSRLEKRRGLQPFGIVSKAFYSQIIEEGGPGRAAQPFLRPAQEAAARLLMTQDQLKP